LHLISANDDLNICAINQIKKVFAMKTFLLTSTVLLFSILLLSNQNIQAQLTCDDAEPIIYTGPDIQAVVTFTTVGVPNDNATSLAPTCGTSVGIAGQHWYSLSLGNTTTASVSITTDLTQTNFDTKLHVYTGQCGSLTCVAGDDDSGTGTTSTVLFDAEPNTTYLIRVGGFNNTAGITALSIDAGHIGCTDPAASNYDWVNVIDDGSCCYPGSMTLGIDAPYGNYARVYSNNVVVATVYPGETVYFCTQKTCDNYIEFFDFYSLGWMNSSYSITIDGITQTGSPVTLGAQYFYVNLETSYCGCTDPTALNFSSTAEMSADNCYYSTNTTCDNAILLQPNTVVMANTSNIPPFLNTVEGCNAGLYGRQLVWYRFVYPGGSVMINTPTSTNDTVLGIFAECGGSAVTCVDDVYYPIADSQYAYWPINAHLRIDCEDGYVKGQTYFIAVGLFTGGTSFPLTFDVFDVPGCTDPLATNYNACASIDDGSCIADTCPADLDNSGFVNIADLLQFVSAYGSDCSNL
jgi:hypothetical protein